MPDLGGTEELCHPTGDSPDFLKDLVGGRGPLERFRVSIPVVRETLDRVAKDPGRGEGAAPDKLTGDYAIPDFDLVHPRRPGRREMKDDPAVLFRQPLTGLPAGVHRSIVQHYMNLLLAFVLPYYLPHQPQEILSVMRGRQLHYDPCLSRYRFRRTCQSSRSACNHACASRFYRKRAAGAAESGPEPGSR